jgi:hypothetical protein
MSTSSWSCTSSASDVSPSMADSASVVTMNSAFESRRHENGWLTCHSTSGGHPGLTAGSAMRPSRRVSTPFTSTSPRAKSGMSRPLGSKVNVRSSSWPAAGASWNGVESSTGNARKRNRWKLSRGMLNWPSSPRSGRMSGVCANSSKAPFTRSLARALRRSANPPRGVRVNRPTATGTSSSRWKQRASRRNASTSTTSQPESSRTRSSSSAGVPRRRR